MILKERKKSISHRILEALNNRMTLSTGELVQYANQIKGFEGEKMFDHILNESGIDALVINDLLLSTRDTFYQIDSLMITDEKIYLYEVKNYSGTFAYKDTGLYSTSGHAIQDPVAQAERKRSYLYNLLIQLGYSIEIEVHVVFINTECYIYDLLKKASATPSPFWDSA